MSRNTLILGIGAALAFGATVALVVPGPERDAGVSGGAAAEPAPVGEAPDPAEARPPGQEVAPEPQEPPAIGIQGRPEPDNPPPVENRDKQPPLNDADAWNDRRDQMTAEWEADVLRITGEWCTEQGVDDASEAAVRKALTAHHAQLRTIRRDIMDRRQTPAQGREAMAALRVHTEGQVREAVGDPQTQSLRDALSVLQGGGF